MNPKPAPLLLVLLAAGCSSGPGELRRTPLIALLDRLEIASSRHELVQLRVVRSGGVERAAIAAHAPAALRLPAFVVPEDAKLRFEIGLDDTALVSLSDGARFVVSVAEPGAPAQEVWSQTLDPIRRREDRGFHDVEIDLAPWSGRTVDLVLATEPLSNPFGDRAAWAHPVVEWLGSAVALPGTVRGARIERDLIGPAPPSAAAASRGCIERVSLAVPAGAALDLAAQVLRDEGHADEPLGPLRFAVRADGVSLLERELVTEEAILTIGETLDLGRFAGRTIELEVELCDTGPGNALVWGRRLWLSRSRELPRARSAAGPNLLVLLVDTLRADHLGTYGAKNPTSPALDALAREALVFDRAISSSSWTLPAVASILTGHTPLEHGVIEAVPFPPPIDTLAERLQDEGVTTFGFSANPIVGQLEAAHRGFETFVQVPWARAGEVHRVFLDWLGADRDDRWFAYLHTIDPHSPYDAPAPHGERFTSGCSTRFADAGALHALSEAINLGRGRAEYTQADVDCLRARYDGEIRHWDAELERLLDALRRRGELENTIVIVTSDHGEEFLEHGHLLHGYQLYEESIHVPLLVRAPGLVEPGRRPEPVETRRIFATALDLMGVDPPETVPPSLLLDEPVGGDTTFSHTTEAYVPTTGYTVLAAARDARWKYVLRPSDGAEELYDLSADPGERSDVAPRETTVRAGLAERLRQWLAGGRPGAAQVRGTDPAALERLRALGYIR